MREMVSSLLYALVCDFYSKTKIYFRSVAVVFALMSGVGLRTRSSIVMVKIVQSLYTKPVMES